MKFCLKTLLVVLTAWFCAVAKVSADEGILGVWKTEPTENGYAHVEVSRADERFEGKIVWLSEPMFPPDDEEGMAGQPKVDRKNPDRQLRGRPIIGLIILKNLRAAGEGVWKSGRIYDPENGMTYTSVARLKGESTLHLRGYFGISLFGRTSKWSRHR